MKGDFVAKLAAGILVIATVLVAAAVFTLFGAVVTQWIWNMLVPSLFYGPEMNYWQALALTILIGLVTGCFKVSWED